MSDNEEEVFGRQPKLERTPPETRIVTRSKSTRNTSTERTLENNIAKGSNLKPKETKPFIAQLTNKTQRIIKSRLGNEDTQATQIKQESRTTQTKSAKFSTNQTQTASIEVTTSTTQTETSEFQEAQPTTSKGNAKITVTIQREQTHQIKMNQKDIQKLIMEGAIPEFSGEDNASNRTDGLSRFIGITDNVYNTLTTDEERKIFCNLIKFKLTGDAYTRISHREIKDYDTLKTVLNNMYARPYTLNELEQKFNNIQQTFGESIRNYGYRLMEALDQYKSGYRSKYKLVNIDETYSNHLNSTAIQAFKRGLNNTILREKIATIKATEVEEIITETESIEQMLITAINPPHLVQVPTPIVNQQRQQTPISNYPQQTARSEAIRCNFCQKLGHTWSICRSRLSQINAPRFQSNPQYNRQQNYQNPNPNRASTPQISANNYTQRPQYNNQSRYPAPQQSNFTQYRQPAQPRNNYEPKYCSHCKTTTGHTFDECRSKFLGNRQYGTNDYPRIHQQPQQQQRQQPPQNASNLEKQFMNMKIGQITPHQMEFHQNQENSNGSSQL